MNIEEVILEATFPTTTTTTTATEGQRSQSTPLQWQIQPSISDILFSGFPQQDTQFWLGYKEYHLNVTTERHQHKISKPQRTNAWKFICMLSDSCRRQSQNSRHGMNTWAWRTTGQKSIALHWSGTQRDWDTPERHNSWSIAPAVVHIISAAVAYATVQAKIQSTNYGQRC